MTAGDASLAPEEQRTDSAALEARVSRDCLSITDRFRTGVIGDKLTAILALQEAIPQNLYAEDTRIKALQSYLTILDNFERIRDVPGGMAQASVDPENGRDGSRNQEPDGEGEPISGDLPIEDVADRASKRGASPTGSDGDNRPRKRLNVAAFPWVIRNQIDPPQLSTQLRRTHSLLENYARDPKTARTHLVLDPRCPQYPYNQWLTLLRGDTADLDQVLSSGYSVNHNDQQTETVGSLEINFGASKPSRIVETHGHWVIAWNQVSDTTVFAFPHRAAELAEYGRHVTQLFASFPESLHQRVINYDRAVRIRVAQRRDLLLTDLNRFTDLHVLWIQSATISGGVSGRLSSRGPPAVESPKRRREPCNRWNSGSCRNSTSSCTYAHVCSRCRSNSHTGTKCSAPRK